ncbi:unnamed protein product [marine sediment metagenome]|uniref:Uncharacterized protein n=1 Tax=marine sediment metagenome TaxID=412755 RepID=X1S8Y2_9ZZZZ
MNGLNTLGKAVLHLLVEKLLHSSTAGLAVILSGEVGNLAATIGVRATPAADGAVTNTDKMMAYIKQLVTLLLDDAIGLAQLQSEIAAIETKVDAGVPKLYVEQIPDTDFDGTVTDTETDCVLVDLTYTAGKTYCLRHLRLKCADPGVGRTVAVKLYEQWNGAITQLIDSFDITPDNYETYHSLMDMFGVPEIHSDAVRIRAVHDGTSPGDDKAIEVTYRYSEATT